MYPCLLRDLQFNEVNQVWATDIAYIPMVQGFMCLAVIMDRHSRCVLSWRLSNTLEADFWVDALEEALSMDVPRIFNTDLLQSVHLRGVHLGVVEPWCPDQYGLSGRLRGQTCSSSGCGGA